MMMNRVGSFVRPGVVTCHRFLATKASSKPRKKEKLAPVEPTPSSSSSPAQPPPPPPPPIAKTKTSRAKAAPTQPIQQPSAPIVAPQTQSSLSNLLLNFPLCADPHVPDVAKILAHDRVVELGLKRYPSVGTVMRDTQTPQQIFLLKRWREKKVSELGSDAEFVQYVQRIKSEGERLHNCLRLFLSEEMPESQLPLVDALRPLWASFRPVLDKISSICAVETAIHHKPLGYIGIADCVAEIDGQLVVIDWKVSERQRTNLAQTYDTPIQIIGYIGALNAHFALNEAQKLFPALMPPGSKDGQYKEPPPLFIPKKPIRAGLAVIGYRDGSPAHVHVMDEGACEHYWQRWLEKVHQFWVKKQSSEKFSPSSGSNTSTHNPQ